MGQLVILAGPSCIGKSPLRKALARCYPEAAGRLTQLVLHTSRLPRPGERDGVDYHFRDREEIAGLRERAGFTVMEVRGDLQALGQDHLEEVLSRGDGLFEGNPFVGSALLRSARERGAPTASLFLAPLSLEEIRFLRSVRPAVSLPAFVADVMRRKLLRRTQKQKGVLGEGDLAEVERRATSAYAELKFAPQYDHVLPNHDGEDSEHWDAFPYPIGDARRALLALKALLEGAEPVGTERWEPDLLP